MAASTLHPQIELSGIRRRGGVQAAVLVLQGATRTDLRRATAITSALADRCLLVAVDGGLKTCALTRLRPDLFVGDGDSSPRIPQDIPAVVYPTQKNHSDLAGALAELPRHRVQLVAVAGMLGGRLDHEWANLFELAAAARKFAAIVAPGPRGTVLITSRGCRAATVRRRSFSLLSLSASATVTLLGPRWELRRQRIRPGSLGLSNLSGANLDLSVHSGTVALVFPPAKRRRTDAAVR